MTPDLVAVFLIGLLMGLVLGLLLARRDGGDVIVTTIHRQGDSFGDDMHEGIPLDDDDPAGWWKYGKPPPGHEPSQN